METLSEPIRGEQNQLRHFGRFEPMTHGGPRPGSGPKTGPHGKKEKIMFRLRPDVIAYLRAQTNQSVTVETVITRTKAFRDWKANEFNG